MNIARLSAAFGLAVLAVGLIAQTAPTTVPSALPPGWVAGLDKEVAGIKPVCLNLWEGLAPGQVKDARPETDNNTRIYGVSIPGAIVYRPKAELQKAAGGTCIIECMGGSYDHLTRLVGADNTVEAFAPRGITVISLKYRLTPVSTDVEKDAVADGKRAIRFARAHAAEWGIDPHKIGLLGWSAGGNLILSLSTHLERNGAGDPAASDPVERESCRPDFVTMLSPWPNGKTIAEYPTDMNSPPPPAFIGSAQDDRTAPFTFAKEVQANWEKAGSTVEFMEIATGGHGAFEPLTGTAKDWPDKFLPWLEKNNLWKAPAK